MEMPSIHTKLSKTIRISSAYRKFANSNFESFGWETFLWNGDNIEIQYIILHSPDEVVNLHIIISNHFWGTGEFYDDRESE